MVSLSEKVERTTETLRVVQRADRARRHTIGSESRIWREMFVS
jgi:hypothetical protein